MPNDSNDPFAHITSFDDVHDIDMLILLCLPFTFQRWYHHLLLISGGILVWLSTYVGVLVLFDWWTLAMTEVNAGFTVRQQSAMAANATVAVYFSIAFVRSYGGFFLTILLYPFVLVSLLLTQLLPFVFPSPLYEFTTVSILSHPGIWMGEMVLIATALVVPLLLIPLSLYCIVMLHNFEKGTKRLAEFISCLPDPHIRVLYAEWDYKQDLHFQNALREVGVNLDEMITDTADSDQPTRIIETPAGDQSMNVLIILVAISLLFLGNYAIIVFLAIGTYLHRQYRRAAIRE